MKLENYLNDGANNQAVAVLAFINPVIEKSWHENNECYEAKIDIGRWENCREQGYVLSLKNTGYKQLNIAFFEHRNSDSICAIKWEQKTINPPNIDNAEFGDSYKDKYDTSYDVGYGEVTKMADWINIQFEQHWGWLEA